MMKKLNDFDLFCIKMILNVIFEYNTKHLVGDGKSKNYCLLMSTKIVRDYMKSVLIYYLYKY